MKDIEIYPSSWYYNACVHGFLEVLAWGLGERGTDIVEEEFLQNDGSVRIPGKLMAAIFSTEEEPAPVGYELREVPDDVKELKRIAWWWVALSSKVEDNDLNTVVKLTSRSMFGSNKTFYPNLLPHNDKTPIEEFLNSWFSLGYKGDLCCSFCNSNYKLDDNLANKYHLFSSGVSKYLGSSLSGMLNLYWNTQASLIMCPLCRSYMLFFHLIHNRNIYINTDFFILNWRLNNLYKQKDRTEDRYKKTFFHAFRYNNQMRNIVGAWGLQNIEFITMEWDDITVQSITEKLATLLLMPEIGALLNKFPGELVWNLFLQERFDYFLTLSYKNLRYFITGKNENGDPEILSNQDNYSAFIAGNLVKLFYTIRIVENKGGKKMGFIDFKEIRLAAKNSPLRISNNTDKGVIFRLLELTRLNKSSDVYHLLLRIYIARGEKFPEGLAKIFSLNDEGLFQTGIYAYIAGLDKSYEGLSDIGEES